jgi:hypothetical protein
METIQNENSKVYLDEHGIFTIEWRDGASLQKEDIEIVVKNYDDHHNGAFWRVLHVFPKGTTITSEARSYAANREKPAGAEAFVIGSFLHRNIFRFYRKFRRVQYPMREFSEKEDALNWILDVKLYEPPSAD